MPNRLIPGLAAFILIGAISASAPIAAKPLLGQSAPDFQLTDAAGQAHRLSDYRGRMVVLEWTNPTCPFVKRHYGEGTMETLSAAYADTQVVWLAINSTHYNTVEETRKWEAEQEQTYPTLLDPDGAVGRLYGARTTPHMFVIDTRGVLRYDGAIDDDPRGSKETGQRVQYVSEALDAILSGGDPAMATTRPYGCSVKYAAAE